MEDWVFEIIKMVLSGLIIAFTSYLTVRFSIERFYKEKSWEKKQVMYTELIEIIYNLKNYASEHYEGEIYPDYLTPEQKAQLKKDWEKYSRELAKLRDLASLHLSENSILILDEYSKKKREARNSNDFLDWIEGDLQAVSECLEKLKEEMKEDLKIK